MRRSLDIIVPVHDEADSIDEFYDRVAGVGYADALLFVDNASTDDTVARLARRPGVRLVRHARNEGYGASVRDGLAASDAERVIVMDADLEYPPEALPAIVAALERHPMVHGSRLLHGRPPGMPVARWLGNRLASALYGGLFGIRTTDLYSGLRGFHRTVVAGVTLRRTGFDHGAEFGALLARRGLRIHDVPVAYRPRAAGRSKMRHVREGALLVGWLLAYWVRDVVLRRGSRE